MASRYLPSMANGSFYASTDYQKRLVTFLDMDTVWSFANALDGASDEAFS